MSTDVKLVIGTLVATSLVIGGAIFWIGKSESGFPERENLGSASLTIDKKSEDFGKMRVDEEKTAVFTITNTSEATLRIWGVSTSCNCTFATVEIGGVKSAEFNMPMHTVKSLQNWIGEVPPKQTAKLLVTYRPKVMPVTGPISRQVRFSTNDPNNTEMEVSITADVL